MSEPRRARVALAAASAAALLHILAALRTPFGAASDDALHLLLARNLLSGGYAVPDAAGAPVTDPLPGFPALMALPVRLLAPHWSWMRGAELLAAAALVFCVWRLCRRLSGEAAGFAAAFLVAVNPALVGWAGVALPDAPFAACAALGFLLLTLPRFSPAGLASVAALAALLRPEGIVLAPALAVGCYVRVGPRRAAAVLAASLAPLGLWLLRGRLVSGSATAYIDHWRAFSETRGAAFAAASAGLVRGFSGPGPFWFVASFGLAAAVVAALGARELNRAKEKGARAAFAALAVFLVCVAALHLGWRAWQSRYALAFIPALVPIFAAAYGAARRRFPAAAAAAVFLAAAPGLWTAAGYAREGLIEPRSALWPKTESWIESNVPADAALTGAEPYLITLLTGRRAYFPKPGASREEWLAALRASGISYVVARPPGPRAYLSAESARLLTDFDAWAVPGPPLSRVFLDPVEGRDVLLLNPSR